MEFWLYVYIAIAILFVFAVIWAYTRVCEWWGVSYSGDNQYLREIFIYENNQHHLLRSYLVENCEVLDKGGEVLELYTENCGSLLENWGKVLDKEHFLKFTDLQRKRWNVHLSLVEGVDEEDAGSSTKELRSTSRRLSQLHEDWWGLKFDASGYMRELNEMDSDVIELIDCVKHSKPSNPTFHSILFHQEAIEKKILKVLN